MARLIFDIETNGLNPSLVWVIVTKDVDHRRSCHIHKGTVVFI